MSSDSNFIGQRGEDVSVAYLEGNGYKVVQRNFRSTHGEIDIIAKDGDVLAFVEVKAYKGDSWRTPFAAITKMKQKSIVSTARMYLYLQKIQDVDCRFDVLAVNWQPDGPPKFDLLKDAFRL
jgi:putative endonuclease